MTPVAFLPTLENGFVWDDDANLVNNPDYRGLGWHQLRWMFTAFHLGHYIPLTWLTFGLDYLVWGMDPAGYHLTNLLLHMTNAVIVYAIAVRLLAAALPTLGAGIAGRLGGAGAAAFFAVHPLRVESVAWATERRDVLVYLRACEAGPAAQGLWRRWRYWAAVGLAALAVLSKSMAVTLPVVLLVLDVYPLRRLGGGWEGWLGAGARRIWLEKAPFVAISGAASLGALVALDKGIIPIDQVSAVDRAAISVYSLAFYLWKTVVPADLSPLYGLPALLSDNYICALTTITLEHPSGRGAGPYLADTPRVRGDQPGANDGRAGEEAHGRDAQAR